MARAFFYILITFLISIINAKELQFDILKQYENDYVKKNIDHEVYKVTKEFSERSVQLNFDDTLKNDEEILIDIEFRFQSKFLGDKLDLLKIQGVNEEKIKLSFSKSTDKFILPMLEIENVKSKRRSFFHGYETETQLFTDLKWHKMNMSITNDFMEIWLDCDIVYKKLIQREDQLTLLKLFEKGIMVFFSFFEDDTKFVTMELKKYEIMKQRLPDSLDGMSCEIPKSPVNKNVVSPLELTPIFGRKYEQNISPTSANKDTNKDKPSTDTIFYRFNNPVERFVRVPDSFTEKTDSKNFEFEIIFRHKGNIDGQMSLMQLTNDKDEDLQSISINSGKIVSYIWNSKKGYQDARAIIKDVDIYDGNWHRLQVELTVKKESPSVWQKIRGKDNYSKKIKFFLDCELIGEDTLTDSLPTLPFNNVEQTGIFFKNNLINSFADFDVRSLQMKDNYEQISCIKVN